MTVRTLVDTFWWQKLQICYSTVHFFIYFTGGLPLTLRLCQHLDYFHTRWRLPHTWPSHMSDQWCCSPRRPSPLLQLQLRTILHTVGSSGRLLQTPLSSSRGGVTWLYPQAQGRDRVMPGAEVTLFISHFNFPRLESRDFSFSYTCSHLSRNLKAVTRKRQHLIFKAEMCIQWHRPLV